MKKKKTEEIRKKFEEIYKDTGVPYISSADCQTIMDNIDKETQSLQSKMVEVDESSQKIDPDVVSALLQKGINTTALETVISSVRLLVEEGLGLWDGKKKVTVLEIGTGAGWSTLLLHNILKERFGVNFLIVSIEKSLVSLASTKLLLENQNIPVDVYDIANLSDASIFNDMSGRAVLIRATYKSACQLFPESYCEGVYSSNGFSYSDRSGAIELLGEFSRILTTGGSIVLDSLNPEYILKLDQSFVKKRVILGGNVVKLTRKPSDLRILIRNNEISEILTFSSCRFLDFLHFLFFKDREEFNFYTEALESSMKAQRLMHNWVQNRSRDIKAIAKYGVVANYNIKVNEIPEYYRDRFLTEHLYTEVVWLKKDI